MTVSATSITPVAGRPSIVVPTGYRQYGGGAVVATIPATLAAAGNVPLVPEGRPGGVLRLGVLGSPPVAAPYDVVREAVQARFGKADAERLLQRPLAVLGGLVLLDMGVPAALVEGLCLAEDLPQDRVALVTQFQRMLAGGSVHRAVGEIRCLALTGVLPSDGLPETPEQPAELVAATNAIRGALYILDTIQRGEETTGFTAHLAGLEVEFHPDTQLPGTLSRPLISADRIYERIAGALRARGVTVTVLPSRSHLVIPADAEFFPAIFEDFVINGRHVQIERIDGTGAHMLYLRDFDGGTLYMRETLAADAFAAEADAYHLVADLLRVDVAEVYRQAMEGLPGYRMTRVFYLKDMKSNMVMLSVECVTPGRALVRGLNAAFSQAGGEPQPSLALAAADFADVTRQLVAMVRNHPELLVPVERIGGLELTSLPPRGPTQERSVLRIGYEKYPDRELVSWTLTREEFPLIAVVIEVLADMGLVGTNDQSVIGLHTHGNVPLKVAGQFSIAPGLALYREFFRHRELFYGMIRPHLNRLPFIKPLPEALRALMLRDDYVVDPADPVQILCVLADVARLTTRKYVDLHVEHWLSSLGEAMIREGIFTDGQVIHVPDWHGQAYEFRVTTQPPSIVFTAVHDDGTRIGEQTLLRTPSDRRKPTAELRTPDTPHRGDGNGYRIDREATLWLLRFWTAWTYLYGTAPFTQPEGMAPLP